jgi:hypothetical protein
LDRLRTDGEHFARQDVSAHESPAMADVMCTVWSSVRQPPREGDLKMAHQQYQACVDACNACADACDHCAAACLQEQDVRMMARCIALDMDCAALCRLAAGAMARGSDHAQQICRLCAEVCDACGDECAKHTLDHCQACAQACRRCADECRRMAA